MPNSREADERVAYLRTLPHAQRTILLMCATSILAHPSGAGIVREIRRSHPESVGIDLRFQVMMDLMVSLAGKWTAGTAVLVPVACLVEHAVEASNDGRDDEGSICPAQLAEHVWALIEHLHDQPWTSIRENATDPSEN